MLPKLILIIGIRFLVSIIDNTFEGKDTKEKKGKKKSSSQDIYSKMFTEKINLGKEKKQDFNQSKVTRQKRLKQNF